MQKLFHKKTVGRLNFPRGKSRNAFCRSGSAAVEAALLLPMLIGITFGAVDIAQFINLAEIVTEASREGTLISCDRHTLTVQEVEDGVMSFMTTAIPGISQEELASGIDIKVRQASDQTIPQGDLTTISPGETISVSVAFDFSVIRWLHGPNYANGNVKSSQSFGRRE
jgi:Flp pilus assembly protein TadG